MIKRPSDSPQLVPINLTNESENQNRAFDISENVLRYQNTCLATKIDYQKKHIIDQRRIITELSERELRYQAFFKGLYVSWQSFLVRLTRVHTMLRRSGECKLQGKFMSALGHLDLVFSTQQQEDVQRNVSQRFGVFLRLIENVQIEVAAEYDQWTQRLQRAMEDLDQRTDESDYVKKLINEYRLAIQQSKEIDQTIKNTLLQREKRVNDLDVQFGQQQVFKIQQLLGESRRENMHLTRRLRLLTDYNFKSIKSKVDEPTEDFRPENYECVCGASQIAAYKPLSQMPFIQSAFEAEETRRPQIESSFLQTNLNATNLKELLSKFVRSRNIKVHQTDDQTVTLTLSETRDLESALSLFFEKSQRIELLTHQNRRLQEQCSKNLELAKEMELKLKNCNEQFFSSPLYFQLYQHNQHLIEQNGQLVMNLFETQNQLNERIQMRQVDINKIKSIFEQELTQLHHEIIQLRAEKASQHLDFQPQAPQMDFEQFVQGIKARNVQLQKVCEAQLTELSSQREQIKDYKQKLNDAEKKVHDSLSKLTEAQEKISQMEIRLPEYKLDISFFRHQKHKEFIQELNQLVQYNAPNLKEKFNELCAYLKSRDMRVAELEKKINSMQQTEIAQLKRHVESMIQETEINQKTYEEIYKNAQQIESQLKIKEESEARIIQEKIAGKAQFDNEKNSLDSKLKYAEDVIRKLRNSNNDLQQMVQLYQTENSKKVEFDILDQDYDSQLKQNCEQLIAEKERLQQQYESLKQKINTAQLINSQMVHDVESQNNRIFELEEQLKQSEELINDPKKLEQLKGYIILKSNEREETQIIQKLNQIASCSNCKVNLKEILIGKCMHLLCQECGQNAAFKEQCPICKIRINISDIWNTKITD